LLSRRAAGAPRTREASVSTRYGTRRTLGVLTGLAAVIALISVAANGPALAASPRWTRVTLPKTPAFSQNTSLNTTWCVSSTDCMLGGGAVGGFLLAKFTGNSWKSTVLKPTWTTGSQQLSVGGITCRSAKFCFAVGNATSTYGKTAGAAFVWNGTSWRDVTPRTGPTRLAETDDTACPQINVCVIVGRTYSGNDVNPVSTPVAWLWRSGTWTTMPGTPATGHTLDLLSAVSCPTTTTCIAVGYLGANSNGQLSMRWNGTSWSQLPFPVGNPNSFPISLACPTVSSCWAGSGGFGGALYRWNGTTWSSPPIPSALQAGGELVSLRCASVTFCSVVSYANAGHVPYGTWDGTTWTASTIPITGTIPPVAGGNSGQLGALSCPSSAFCLATGYHFVPDGPGYVKDAPYVTAYR
jgi:hypothetical protein